MNLENYAVLNACNPIHLERESDSYVDYRGGLKTYFRGPKMVKKCVSWHSIPASFQSEFFVYGHEGWQGILKYDHILVMIKDDLASLKPLIAKLKMMGKVVGLAYHENGNYFSNSSQNLNWLLEFKDIVDRGDYFWNLNMCLESFFQELLDVHVFSSWHGAPYDEWNHTLTVPRIDREGIMIGTRTLLQNLRRNTLYAIGIANKVAAEIGTHVTYCSEDQVHSQALAKVFEKCGFHNTRIVEGPRPYEEWLRVISTHRVLFHLDASETLGQVVADAMLLDIPSVGSETTNNNLMSSNSSMKYANDRLKHMYAELTAAGPKLYDWKHIKSRDFFKNQTSFAGLRERHENHLFLCLK